MHHGDDVVDEYAWMADKSHPDLLDNLRAENAYAEAATAHLAPLRDTLYSDISARTRQTDLTVPAYRAHWDGSAYWYVSRTTEGLDYPRHCRIPATSRDQVPDATRPHPDEQLLLDVNDVASGHEYTALGTATVSPDGRALFWSVDTAGDERYELFVTDLDTGAASPLGLTGVGAGGVWVGTENVAYLRVDDAWRPHQAWLHRLGTDPADDVLLHEEPDERFWMGLSTSRDEHTLLVELGSRTTTETWLLDAAEPQSRMRCVAPRRDGVEYEVEVAPDALYILHNDGAPQFALATAPVDATSADQWRPLIAENPRTRLMGVDAYTRALVVSHLTDGLPGVDVIVRHTDGTLGARRPIEFDEAIYDVDADGEPDVDTDRIRLTYESMVTPPRVIEYRLDDGTRTILKQTPVDDHPTLGPYRSEDYVQHRLWIEAPDGVQVPVSLVARADVARDGTAPGLLYGYGSYEISTQPWFSIARLSLLDRGWVVAIAHVRGGGELGRPWYENGRRLDKRNTFTDFVAAGRALVEQGWVAPGRLAAEGGSAGGLLVGAAMNIDPDAFCAVHAAVPFVDALTTVLNPDLPLTVVEWEEWGDPLHDADVYRYMKSYSPYENIAPVRYPAILATTSFNDTRVEVTEPAKWVARLRATLSAVPDARSVLLRTTMDAGHGGVSGRYAAWRDRAWEMAWLIDATTGGAERD